MKLIDVIQGTDEWHRLRARYNTASEAPVMMGASSKMRRNELLHMKATGSEKEVSDWVQKNLFDKGHACEAQARLIVEQRLGEDLFPVTGVCDAEWLLASYDGLTMLGDTGFEHKLWNESLAEAVRNEDLPPEYYWQLEHQILVGNLERVIFVVSDGTEGRFASMVYRPVEGRAAQLIAGWRQFDKDLAAYVPTEAKPAAVGRTPESLPALRVELTGKVTASNLDEFKAHALEVISSINRDLQTDQDFADAEKAVKWCDDVEQRVKRAKEHALSQTQTIDELFRGLDEISASARATRLELDKLVKQQKEQRRLEIKTKAERAFAEHIEQLNTRLGRFRLPPIRADFATPMKGKRTLETLQNAADTELARLKIEADGIAERIEHNVEQLRSLGANDYRHLFSDAQELVLKDADAVSAIVQQRISEHQQAEEKRLETERERIREEERQRLEREQAAAQAAATPPQPEPEPMPEPEPEQPAPAPQAQTEPTPAAVAPMAHAAPANEPATATAFKAEVIDLYALVMAVADGLVPLDVLQVNQAALDRAIAANGGRHAFPGVRLSNAA